LLVVAVIVLAVVGAIVAVPLAHYTSDDPGKTTPATAAVIVRSSDLPVRGQLLLSWSDSRTLKAAAIGGGTVTAVFARAGHAVRCGSAVMEIDGKAIVAICGKRPLWRRVTGGTAGADVSQVITMLRGVGRLSTAKPTSGQLTSAIRSWQKAVHMAVTGAVGPENTVWIGHSITPSAVPVVPGDVAVPAMQILTTAPHLTSARFLAEGSDSPTGEARVVSATGMADAVSMDAHGNVDQPSKLEGSVVGASRSDSGPPKSIDAVSRLRSAISVKVVPVTAVVSVGTATCVLATNGSGSRPVPVKLVDSDIDGVLLIGDLAAGQQVVVNPGASVAC